jgi:hypothetical protein
MDRVGFEPTISALFKKDSFIPYLKAQQLWKEKNRTLNPI